VLASYSAFRPVRDALILDGDPEQIPWLFTATFVVAGLLSPLWGALVAKHPRRVVPIAFHVFAACAVGFFALVRSELAPVAVGRVFYVWSAVFNLFVVSILWSLLADLLGPGTARRLYGPIAAGGTAGTLIGPALTRLFVGTIGVAGVLLMSAALLELAVVAIAGLARAATPTDEPGDAIVAGRALDGLRHVAKSPYLASIVGYVLCTATAATFVYLQQAQIAHDALLDRGARAELFASIDLLVAIATLVLQLGLAGPLLGWLGPGLVLCVLPLVQLGGIATLAIAPSITALMIVQTASRSATHGLTRPARELLFTVVDRNDKYRAKNVIDTVVYRLGDFGSSWLYRGLAAAGAGGASLIVATVPLVAGWLVLATLLGIGYRRRTQ